MQLPSSAESIDEIDQEWTPLRIPESSEQWCVCHRKDSREKITSWHCSGCDGGEYGPDVSQMLVIPVVVEQA
jgi:hypothetical protein